VGRMSDPQFDPAGSTQAFRAFAQRREAEAAAEAEERQSRRTMWIAVGAALVVVLAIVVFLLAG